MNIVLIISRRTAWLFCPGSQTPRFVDWILWTFFKWHGNVVFCLIRQLGYRLRLLLLLSLLLYFWSPLYCPSCIGRIYRKPLTEKGDNPGCAKFSTDRISWRKEPCSTHLTVQAVIGEAFHLRTQPQTGHFVTCTCSPRSQAERVLKRILYWERERERERERDR